MSTFLLVCSWKTKEKNENNGTHLKFLSDKKDESNYKYEKKVHFAQLMSKVHAEISSSSDVELGSFKGKDNEQQITTEKPLAASTQTLIYQPKSPHSTSSNQGSDSLSSSEMTLISASGILQRTYLWNFFILLHLGATAPGWHTIWHSLKKKTTLINHKQ